MDNLEELEDNGSPTNIQECLTDNGVLECATIFAQSFTPCDESLPPVPHRGSLPLFPFLKQHRGMPSLGPKKKLVYEVDDKTSTSIAVYFDAPQFSSHRSPTMRFFSIYAEFPSDETLKSLGVDIIRLDAKEVPRARIERTIFHPVTQGCMRQSGLGPGRISIQSEKWMLHWGARFKEEEIGFSSALPYQRINHFPGTWLIGRKDNLARCIQKGKMAHPKEFDFHPQTYIMPADVSLLQRDVEKGGVFLVKPPASARGKGISLFTGKIPSIVTDYVTNKKQQKESPTTIPVKVDSDEEEEDDDQNDECIVQHYYDKPLLINGFKCDLRLYVCVTSFNPLSVYIYNEGLVRFATQPYTSSDINNTLAHLTNYSLNKSAQNYSKTEDAEGDGSGSKWSLHALKRFFEQSKWEWDPFWAEVEDVVVKTLISCESSVAPKVGMFTKAHHTCFELYGFDIFMTEDRKAKLIEVNVLPSLACGSALDKHIKGNMIGDMLTLVGVPVVRAKAEGCNNTMQKSSKNTKEVLGRIQNDKNYFVTATDDEKALLRNVEEEFRRAGAWNRVVPSPTSDEKYGHLFDSKRVPNAILWRWEKLKPTLTPDQLKACVAWLEGKGDFPIQCKTPGSAVAPSKKKIPLAPTPQTRVNPVVTRKSSVTSVSRVSSVPKFNTGKVELEQPSEKKAVPIKSFTFT